MLTGWRDLDDTLRAFDQLQRRIDRTFDSWATPSPAGDRLRRRASVSWPATNVFETKESFVVRAEVPGLAENDVSVSVEDDSLVVRGERKCEVPHGYGAHSARAFLCRVHAQVSASGARRRRRGHCDPPRRRTHHYFAQSQRRVAATGRRQSGLTSPRKSQEEVMSDISSVRENNGSLSTRNYQRRAVAPPVDVLENADELRIVADVPGVSSDEIELRVENGTLSLQARRSVEREAPPALVREYDDVDFATTFRIPAGIDTAGITAETKNGTLIVRLPKAAEAKPRRVPVR